MSELRETATFAVEFRVPDLAERIVEGIVVPWDEVSELVPGGAERFKRGALDRTITERKAPVKLFVNHDHRVAVGKAVAWDLDHADGLFGRFQMYDTPAGHSTLHEVREGALDQFSIGFVAKEERRAPDGVREVLQARLYETSLAALGAYDGARVLAVRTPALEALPDMPAVNLEPLPTLTRGLVS